MKQQVSTMNISMPTPLRQKLDAKVRRLGAYGSTSDYVRDLIRRDLARDAIARVDVLLSEGEDSGPPEAVDERWWKARHADLAKHRRETSRKSKRA
jgi:antitoxin ParD1/3/4